MVMHTGIQKCVTSCDVEHHRFSCIYCIYTKFQ